MSVYHYTSIKWVDVIANHGGMLKGSSSGEAGAGVYLTDMPPQTGDGKLEINLRQHADRFEAKTMAKSKKHGYIKIKKDALAKHGFKLEHLPQIEGGRQFIVRQPAIDLNKFLRSEWDACDRM
jgi:hypothetical protein